jgi:hypothetical protein
MADTLTRIVEKIGKRKIGKKFEKTNCCWTGGARK